MWLWFSFFMPSSFSPFPSPFPPSLLSPIMKPLEASHQAARKQNFSHKDTTWGNTCGAESRPLVDNQHESTNRQMNKPSDDLCSQPLSLPTESPDMVD